MGTAVAVTRTPMDDLDPRQRLAVELYTNPLLGRTFGNKMASAKAAGFSNGNAMNSVAVQEAVAWIMERKTSDAAMVKDYLTGFAMDAARKLVKQLGADDGIEPIPIPDEYLVPPPPILLADKDGREYVAGYDESKLKVVDRITASNRATAGLMKEAREALKLLLAYHMGTPEQSNRNRGKEAKEGDPLDLGALGDAELRELARHVQEVLEMKQAAEVTVADEAGE
jgi:hypothetical protein